MLARYCMTKKVSRPVSFKPPINPTVGSVLIKCPTTGKFIPTQHRAAEHSFRSGWYKSQEICSECGALHDWTTHDAWLSIEGRIIPGKVAPPDDPYHRLEADIGALITAWGSFEDMLINALVNLLQCPFPSSSDDAAVPRRHRDRMRMLAKQTKNHPDVKRIQALIADAKKLRDDIAHERVWIDMQDGEFVIVVMKRPQNKMYAATTEYIEIQAKKLALARELTVSLVLVAFDRF